MVFEFESVQFAAVFFDVIDLLLGGRAPEIHIAEVVAVGIAFDPFCQQEIFPQGAGILSQRQGIEIADDGSA